MTAQYKLLCLILTQYLPRRPSAFPHSPTTIWADKLNKMHTRNSVYSLRNANRIDKKAK